MQISGVEIDSLEYQNIGSWPSVLKRILIVTIALMAILVGYWFDLSDIVDELDKISQQRKKLQQEFANTHHQVVNLEAYRKQVTEVRALLNLLTQQLPKTSEEANLLDDISQQASLSGLKFVSIKPSVEENKGFYTEQPINISLLGTYHGFGEFVSNLSTLSRIVTLHNFSIKQDEKDPGTLNIDLGIKTYWISPHELVPKDKDKTQEKTEPKR